MLARSKEHHQAVLHVSELRPSHAWSTHFKYVWLALITTKEFSYTLKGLLWNNSTCYFFVANFPSASTQRASTEGICEVRANNANTLRTSLLWLFKETFCDERKQWLRSGAKIGIYSPCVEKQCQTPLHVWNKLHTEFGREQQRPLASTRIWYNNTPFSLVSFGV